MGHAKSPVEERLMPDLSFEITGAEVVPYSVLPTLIFKMRIANESEEERIHNVNLKCQIMLSVTKRRYSAAEKARIASEEGALRKAANRAPSDWQLSIGRVAGTPTLLAGGEVVATWPGAGAADVARLSCAWARST